MQQRTPQNTVMLIVVGLAILLVLWVSYKQWYPSEPTVEGQIAIPTPPPPQCSRHDECPDGMRCEMNGTCVPFKPQKA